MNEIAERLRNWRLVHLTQLRYLMETASDEIERLQALADKRGELAVDRRREIERLRELLSRTGSEAEKTADDASECRSHGVKTPERERLTAAEREAIAYYLGTGGPYAVYKTLSGLLSRLSPPAT